MGRARTPTENRRNGGQRRACTAVHDSGCTSRRGSRRRFAAIAFAAAGWRRRRDRQIVDARTRAPPRASALTRAAAGMRRAMSRLAGRDETPARRTEMGARFQAVVVVMLLGG